MSDPTAADPAPAAAPAPATPAASDGGPPPAEVASEVDAAAASPTEPASPLAGDVSAAGDPPAEPAAAATPALVAPTSIPDVEVTPQPAVPAPVSPATAEPLSPAVPAGADASGAQMNDVAPEASTVSGIFLAPPPNVKRGSRPSAFDAADPSSRKSSGAPRGDVKQITVEPATPSPFEEQAPIAVVYEQGATAPAESLSRKASTALSEREELMHSTIIEPKAHVSETDNALTKSASAYGRRIISTPGGWVLEELPKSGSLLQGSGVLPPAGVPPAGGAAEAPSAGVSRASSVRLAKDITVDENGARVLPSVEFVDVVSEHNSPPASRRSSLHVEEEAAQEVISPSASPRSRRKRTKANLKRSATKRRKSFTPSPTKMLDEDTGVPTGCAAPHASPVMGVIRDAPAEDPPFATLTRSNDNAEQLRALRLVLADKEAALWQRQQAARAARPAGADTHSALAKRYAAMKARAVATQRAIAERDQHIRHLQGVQGAGGAAAAALAAAVRETAAARQEYLSGLGAVEDLLGRVAQANDALLAGVENTFDRDIKLYHTQRTLKKMVMDVRVGSPAAGGAAGGAQGAASPPRVPRLVDPTLFQPVRGAGPAAAGDGILRAGSPAAAAGVHSVTMSPRRIVNPAAARGVYPPPASAGTHAGYACTTPGLLAPVYTPRY